MSLFSQIFKKKYMRKGPWENLHILRTHNIKNIVYILDIHLHRRISSLMFWNVAKQNIFDLLPSFCLIIFTLVPENIIFEFEQRHLWSLIRCREESGGREVMEVVWDRMGGWAGRDGNRALIWLKKCFRNRWSRWI